MHLPPRNYLFHGVLDRIVPEARLALALLSQATQRIAELPAEGCAEVVRLILMPTQLSQHLLK
ncbi:MAG: hypothetical protein Q7T58_01480 [Methylotenera sp.]|nr:hypothetical protein [Methylotenera sp.]